MKTRPSKAGSVERIQTAEGRGFGITGKPPKAVRDAAKALRSSQSTSSRPAA